MAFMIVGKDEPMYELDMLPKREDAARLAQFIIHGALDMVDAVVWTSRDTYLRSVDRYGDQVVSAYVTVGGAKLMLLHDGRNEEGVKSFFTDVHEVYVKLLLNPFYRPFTSINNAEFDARVRTAARRFLGYRGE